MGQIYYFERPRTGDSQNTVVDEKDETGSMVWAGDSMWRYNDNWGLKGGIQYDRRLGSVSMSNATLEYRQDAERLIQLNYRYVDRDYIQAMRQHTGMAKNTFHRQTSKASLRSVLWPAGQLRSSGLCRSVLL